MASEPMITIKDADGTMKQVPLSQLAQQSAPPSEEKETTAVLPAESSKHEAVETETVVADDIAELEARAAAQVAVEAHVQPTDTQESDATVSDEEPVVLDESTVDAHVQKGEAPAPEDNNEDVPVTSEMSATVHDMVPAQDEEGETNITTPDSTSVTSPSSAEPIDDDLMIIPEAGALATTVPNRHVFEAQTDTDWDDGDHASLLDEALTEVDTTVPHSTSRPGMAEALRAKEVPIAAPSQMANTSSEKSPPKKPNTEQFNAAFSALALRTDLPYTPGLKKVPMQDIVAAPTAPSTAQLIGPVAELGAMTLDDFRRLGGRGEVGIADLRQKFELLLKESIVTYLQGVTAWHQSPLYRTYLGMIEASITGHITMEEVFAMYASNSEAMTAAEWQALAGLHADIRL